MRIDLWTVHPAQPLCAVRTSDAKCTADLFSLVTREKLATNIVHFVYLEEKMY